jgi:hypothetical protein
VESAPGQRIHLVGEQDYVENAARAAQIEPNPTRGEKRARPERQGREAELGNPDSPVASNDYAGRTLGWKRDRMNEQHEQSKAFEQPRRAEQDERSRRERVQRDPPHRDYYGGARSQVDDLRGCAR